MTNSTDLMQLYILISYEKLQRSTISQRHRPIEGSLCNRLLVWRFIKKIENEPVTFINSEQEFLPNPENDSDLDANNSWMLDINANYDNEHELDMDIESDLLTIVGNNELNTNSTCETMNIDQTSDVNLLLKRAIGAERRQKLSTDTNNSNPSQISKTNTYEETEQFFHDLCAELTNTTASLVSSSTTNTFNFEQTLIH